MCYHFYLASPLTLSEVRSMLPAGMAADLLSPEDQRALTRRSREARTAARLVHGACSCDLVARRHRVTREDEASLRRRYREQGLGRQPIIRALEFHRLALERPPQPEGHWPRVTAEFVVEHARNAGPTLYYLGFSATAALGPVPEEPPLELTAGDVGRGAGAWLPEGRLVLVRP
ncbi:MAG: hypothetical protein ACREMO_11445 [Gemmatimonadales bacterium]